MRVVKSERLKKLEVELNDLEQWLKLSLVPKKDVEKHKLEISAVKQKINEELERLQFLKENGEAEEFIAPKRTGRAGMTDMPTLPDIDIPESAPGFTTEAGFEMESENTIAGSSRETTEGDEETEEATKEEATDWGEEEEDKDEESYFSDRNRWKRGGIIDPDADDW